MVNIAEQTENLGIHVKLGGVFSKTFHLFYFCCIFSCVATLVYHWTILSCDLSSEPITTLITSDETARNFPTIMVCPQHLKYNFSKVVKAINISYFHEMGYFGPGGFAYKASDGYAYREVMHYFMSLESASYFKGIITQSDWYLRSGLDERNYTLSIKKGIYNYVLADKSYQEMELELTADFDAIIMEQPNFPIVNKRKLMSVTGACYVFEINVTIPAILSQTTDVQFGMMRSSDFNKIFYDHRASYSFFERNSDHMFLGEPTFWPKNPSASLYQFGWEVVTNELATEPTVAFRSTTGYYVKQMKKEFEFEVVASSITFHRQNLRRRPCRDWNEHDRSICLVQCFNEEFCSKLPTPCLIFHPNQTREDQHGRLCSWIEGDVFYLTGISSHCLTSTIIGSANNDFCDKQCPIQCHEELYYFTHIRSAVLKTFTGTKLSNTSMNILQFQFPPESDKLWGNVTLKYQGSKTRLKFEEKLFWSPDIFAAQFASAMSLWTGASGLAISQLLILLCSIPLTKKDE